MPRGPKKHLKRLNAPKHWMLDKMSGVWAPRPSPGPHGLRECLPLVLILRNRLKYALTFMEAEKVLRDREVEVDGKVRTDTSYPAGFMDVIHIRKTGENFRLVYDPKGRFHLVSITPAQAQTKLCRVKKYVTGSKGIPYIVTHDGRTIRFANPTIRPGDTVKINLKDNSITDWIQYETGNLCMITGGKNVGRVGTISKTEKHLGSFTAVHVTDSTGTSFITRAENVFVIGKGDKAMTELPRDAGIRADIFENRARELAAQKRDE